MKRTIALTALGLALLATTARAQDMMRDLDLTSPAMVSAEMSRQELEAALAKASAGEFRLVEPCRTENCVGQVETTEIEPR